jgi:hypothetical protein
MAESETILASHLALIEQLYDRLRSGVDVAPGERLRLEGRLELLVELGIASHKQLEEAISQRYLRFFGEPVDPLYWQWMASANRIYLPCRTNPAQLEVGTQ